MLLFGNDPQTVTAGRAAGRSQTVSMGFVPYWQLTKHLNQGAEGMEVVGRIK